MDENDELGCGISQPPRNTAKKDLPDSCIVRKSAHGRAKLYLDDANYLDMRCSSSITQHQQRHSLFHRHGQNGRLPDEFTRPTSISCFHCCHPFDTPPVPMPKDYDTSSQSYVVYGNFCSLSCCKRFLCDTSTFNSGLQVLLLHKMAREIYGVEKVVCAPPRLSLSMFGGPYSIERFRSIGEEKRVIEHAPPFVCAYHVIEERDQQHDTAALDGPLASSMRGLRRMPAAFQEDDATELGEGAGSKLVSFLKKEDKKNGGEGGGREEKAGNDKPGLSPYEIFLMQKEQEQQQQQRAKVDGGGGGGSVEEDAERPCQSEKEKQGKKTSQPAASTSKQQMQNHPHPLEGVKQDQHAGGTHEPADGSSAKDLVSAASSSSSAQKRRTPARAPQDARGTLAAFMCMGGEEGEGQ